MKARAPHRDRTTVWLLVPALLAIAPAIQFCPLTSAQAGTPVFVPCQLLDLPAAAVIPVSRPKATSACGNACPAAGAAACASPACAATASSHSPRARSSRVVVYCMGDPAGSRALRSSTKLLTSPAPLIALLAFANVDPPQPTPVQTQWPELRARAPTRQAATQPPVRAPPAAS